MKQRQRWPAELRAAIDAADAEGIPANRILKLARSGELDGIDRPFKIPQSTFFDILAKGRRARIASTEPVAPGEEEEVAGAILRRVLEIAKRELAKTDAALSDPRKSASERATLARTLDILRKTVRSYESKVDQPRDRSKDPQRRAGEASAQKRSDPLSDLIAAQERRLSQEPASPLPNTGDTSVSPPSTETDHAETQETEAEENDNSDGHDDGLLATRASVPVAA